MCVSGPASAPNAVNDSREIGRAMIAVAASEAEHSRAHAPGDHRASYAAGGSMIAYG